jgi:hypothetical protein
LLLATQSAGTGISSALDRKMINAKVLLRNLETIIGVPAVSFERCMGKVDGSV